MDTIGQINNRQIMYLPIKRANNWINQLPASNWLALPISDTQDKDMIDKIVNACLDNKVNYICALGQECEWIHDWFDETIVWRRIKNGKSISASGDFDEEPMTTWHHDFNEGFWFATTAAYPTVNDEYIPVYTVVCIDLTEKGVREQLVDLIVKIKSGWLPSDNELADSI